MSPATYSVAGIPGNPRQGWIDWLRVLACFMVVLSHCCDGFVAQFDSDHTSFLTGVIIGSLMRPCVPLFVMMTGVLLLPLPSTTSLPGFYRRRLGRIIPPLIFWSIALPLLTYAYISSGSPTANPAVDVATYTPQELKTKLWTWLLNFNYDTTPLWYLYMLVGLYLIIPILSGWMESASKRDMKVVLAVWAFTLILPYVELFAPSWGYPGNYGHLGILGECDWNSYGTFYYVSGFAGYLLLATYLKKFPPTWSDGKLITLSSISFIVGYAVTSGMYVWFQNHYPGDYAYLEIAWFFTGINVFMMTVPVFIIMQRFAGHSGQIIRYVAGLTFGIYLCHFVFVIAAYDLFDVQALPAWLRIILMSLTAFAGAAALTALMSLTRFTSRFIK